MQYDENGLARFNAELDSPLPGRRRSAAAQERQAEDEMALFNQAKAGM